MAKKELTPEARFHKAEQYLIELLRLYRDKYLLTINTRDGETMSINAMLFVRREIAADHLKFPFEETEKQSTKIKIKEPTIWKLTVLFQRAIIEYKRAYALIIPDEELKAQQLIANADARNEWAKNNIHSFETAEILPFHENNKNLISIQNGNIWKAHINFLSEIGISRVTSPEDVRDIFYELSIRGRQLDDRLITLILDISVDPVNIELMLKYYQTEFNNLITRHTSRHTSIPIKDETNDETEIDKLKNRITNLENKLKLYEGAKKHRAKVGTECIKQLRLFDSRFFKSFNLENEEDRKEYIHWFALAKIKIRIKDCNYWRYQWPFSPEAWNQFLILIEQHNAMITDDDDDDNNNN